MGDPEPLTSLASGDLDQAQIRQIGGANACKLFHIDS
jgi:hypothetical protein